MSFVDFKINSIKSIEAIQQDNIVEVNASFYRGDYQNSENPITNEIENRYVRMEKFEAAVIIFVPNDATEQEINEQLYDLLLEYKKLNDEVIPECKF